MKHFTRIALSMLCLWMGAQAAMAKDPDRATIVEIDEVLDSYDNDREKLSATVSRLQQLSRDFPESTLVLLRLSVGQARLGDLQGAKVSISKLLAIDPTNVQAVAVRGNLAWKSGDIAAATKDFGMVLEVKPRHAVANNFKAYQAIQAGSYKDAVNHARDALVGNPKNLNSYALMSYAYHQMNDPYMARLVALSGKEIADTFADTYNVLGLIENDSDQLGFAGSNLRKALELEPDHIAANLNLASFALSVSDFDTAIKHLAVVEKSEPNNVKAALAKGVALRGLNRYGEAEAAYLRVLTLDPQNLDVRYNLCVVTQEYKQDLPNALKWCGEFASRITKKHPKFKEMKNRISGIRATMEMMEDEEETTPSTPATTPDDQPKNDETPEKP